MRNKMIGIIGVIALLFLALYVVNNIKTKRAVEDEGNPYGKEDLHQATVDQLDDPLYQNQITPDKLAEELENEEDMTVYFYDPLCPHCVNTTPVLVPVADDHDIDLKKLNLREFGEEQSKYAIEGTPTLVHFKNGEEAGRISGEHPAEDFEAFFAEYILDEKS